MLADHYPGIEVVLPGDDVAPIAELLPRAYRQPPQRLRFRAAHLPAVREGSKRTTMRYNDPVAVGPALLVFELDDEVTLPGRITSTVARRVDQITDDEAREDGFTAAADVLPGLRDYYPGLEADSEVVIVRFDVEDTAIYK